MKILVGKLKRVDAVPCKKVNLEKLAKKAEKDTVTAMGKLFIIELKNREKMNKILSSSEYSDFLDYIKTESNKLEKRITEKANKIIADADIVDVCLVVNEIRPSLSLKRTDIIGLPSIAAENFWDLKNIEKNADETQELVKDKEEIKNVNKVCIETVKKVKKIIKKEDEV
jgi:hypothetical protein